MEFAVSRTKGVAEVEQEGLDSSEKLKSCGSNMESDSDNDSDSDTERIQSGSDFEGENVYKMD